MPPPACEEQKRCWQTLIERPVTIVANVRTAFSFLRTVSSYLKMAPGKVKVGLHEFNGIFHMLYNAYVIHQVGAVQSRVGNVLLAVTSELSSDDRAARPRCSHAFGSGFQLVRALQLSSLRSFFPRGDDKRIWWRREWNCRGGLHNFCATFWHTYAIFFDSC